MATSQCPDNSSRFYLDKDIENGFTKQNGQLVWCHGCENQPPGQTLRSSLKGGLGKSKLQNKYAVCIQTPTAETPGIYEECE